MPSDASGRSIPLSDPLDLESCVPESLTLRRCVLSSIEDSRQPLGSPDTVCTITLAGWAMNLRRLALSSLQNSHTTFPADCLTQLQHRSIQCRLDTSNYPL